VVEHAATGLTEEGFSASRNLTLSRGIKHALMGRMIHSNKNCTLTLELNYKTELYLDANNNNETF